MCLLSASAQLVSGGYEFQKGVENKCKIVFDTAVACNPIVDPKIFINDCNKDYVLAEMTNAFTDGHVSNYERVCRDYVQEILGNYIYTRVVLTLLHSTRKSKRRKRISSAI